MRSEDEKPFDLGLLTRLVWGEKSILRDVAIGSITITILSVLPVADDHDYAEYRGHVSQHEHAHADRRHPDDRALSSRC